jgi:hypothetical protein
MLTLKRLLPSDKMAWMYYPEWERRVLAFLDNYGSNMDDGQRQEFTTELRQRFAATPDLSGYWLMLEGEGLNQQFVGHICAWIAVRYGRPYVMLFQTEIDVQWEGRETLVQAMNETRLWITDINRQLAEKNQKSINSVEIYTIKAVKAWQAWLPELDIEKEMTVMRINIPEQAVVPRTSWKNGHMVQ